MNEEPLIILAKSNKYKVLEGKMGNNYFFVVDADPINLGEGHSWNGKTTIATNLAYLEYEDTPELREAVRKSRIQDMKDDCMKIYGKNSESYKKIIWPDI